ncbi:hypothetical protein QBC45DRAFT_462546 [Copromyces sp. CBS 386.78]|nr:hypothetical protein QBC45DRAFT_462546 [Copromyces sp. CBS 386.78]
MKDRDKNGQSAEDEAERQRKAILEKAMMDDLGISRVEDLPLEDIDAPPRHGRHDGRRPDRLTMPQPAPAVSDFWAEAQRQGVFNDDDALAVKDLDPLGGGRLYATRQEVAALGNRLIHGIRDHAQRVLNPELESRLAKQYHGRGREIPPNRKINIGKGMKTSALGVVYHEAQPVRQFPPGYQPSTTTPTTQVPMHTLPPSRPPRPLSSTAPRQLVPPKQELSSSRNGVTSPATSTAPSRETSRAPSIEPRWLSVIQAQTQSRLTVASNGPRQTSASQQLRDVGNENLPLSPEPSNVVFRCEVDFPIPLSALDRSSVPSRGMVYLSAAERPQLGFFTSTRDGNHDGQWPISHYYHHTLDSSRQLIILFRGPDGQTVKDTCTVNFTSYMDAEDFHKTLKRLRAGEYLGQVNESSRQVLEPTVQEASSTPAPQNPVSRAQAEQATTSDSDTVVRQPYAPNLNTARAENQEVQAGTLIDFDTFDDYSSTVQPSYAQSEAAELLSTLDPIDYDLEHVDDYLQFQQAQAEAADQNYGLDVIKQEFVDRYRLLLQNLIKVVGEVPRHKTNRGASTMIDGLQICVMKNAMADECGLDDTTKKELLRQIWGDSQPVDAEDSTNDIQSASDPPPNRPETPRPPPATAETTPRETTRAPPPRAATQTRRRVYQRPFLVSLYDNRLQPPHWFQELAFMPAFSRRNQPPLPCQSLEDTLTAATPATPTPLPAAANLPLDFSRTRASHAWVMATEASETVRPTPSITSESTVQEAQAETQEPHIEESTPVISLETTASPSHEEHVDADIHSVPELISLAVPEPIRPSSTHANLRGLRNSRWARPGDRLETEGAFTGPQFWSSTALRELAQLEPQAPVNATPAQLAEMFSAKSSGQSIEHATPRLAPAQQNDRPTAVPDNRPATPPNDTSSLGGLTQTPLATHRVVDTATQQASSISVPPPQVEPPVRFSSHANRGLAGSRFAISPVPESSSVPAPPRPEQSTLPSNSTNLCLAGSRFARSLTPDSTSGTNSPAVQDQSQAPVVEAQPPALAPKPVNRGLAGSRFASGEVLSSSGSFTGLYHHRT